MSRFKKFVNKYRAGSLNPEGKDGIKTCPNCSQEITQNGAYCTNCGQRYTDGKISFKFLILDFFENILNVDSKLFRSIGALLMPGKLTNDYFKGQHKTYASPSRIFFIAAVVHFSIINFLVKDTISLKLGEFVAVNREAAYSVQFKKELSISRLKIDSLYPGNDQVKMAIDTLLTPLNKYNDSISIGIPNIDSNWNIEKNPIKFPLREVYTKDLDKLADSKNIKGSTNRLIFKQIIRVFANADNFGSFILSKMVWMVVLMMPGLALLLKLIYIRRKRYFVEHLVFSFHYHAFAFWVFSFLFIISHLTNSWESNFSIWAYTIAGISTMIYLFISMKKVYQQGSFKTFLKFLILNYSYLMIFLLCLLVTLFVSMAFY